jgi:isopentenyl-diphosphate Delta-isomerase
MDNQIILKVDEKGQFTGEYVDKWEAHTGDGHHHKAITVLIYNSKGEVLLQKRKHKVHNEIWDCTISTHQLHREDGTDETDEEAVYRGIEREYGITEKIPLENLGGVHYFAPYGDFCENEFDIFLTAKYNSKLKPNEETEYGHKWMDKNEFLKDIKLHPKNYAPWVVEGLKMLKKSILFKA